jgi:FeS assembly SUF system protein
MDQEIGNREKSAEGMKTSEETVPGAAIEKERIIEAIRTCYDPEIPVNIHEMGLIYGIDIDASGGVAIQMTLTSPNCPSAASLPLEVESKVKTLPGVSSVKVDVVWDPIWEPSMMSEAARLQLGMFW